MLKKILTVLSKAFHRRTTEPPSAESPEEHARKYDEILAAFPAEALDTLSQLTPEYAATLQPFMHYSSETYFITVTAGNAESIRQILHAKKLLLGYYPVILSDDMGDMLADPLPYEKPFLPAPEIDAEAYFREQMPESFHGIGAEMFELPPVDEVAPTQGLSELGNLAPETEVRIILFPSPHGYDLFNYMPYGGWNDCPNDEYHRAILKYWNEKYGAELAAIGASTIELYLQHPVTDVDEALLITKEQYIYCSDVIDGVAASFGELARKICKSHYWYFWWD